MERGRTGRRRAAAVLLCIQLVGCHSWHVETAAPATVLAERHPSRVRITRLDGHRQVVYQPWMEGEDLEGLAGPDGPGHPSVDSLRIPVAEVSELATSRLNTGRTVVAVVGGLLGVTLFAIVVSCASSGNGCYLPPD